MILQGFTKKALRQFTLMIKKWIIFLAIISLSGCGHPQNQNQDYDQKIKKAQKALEKNYNNPKTHTYLGILYEKRGLINQAEKHYRIAIELDSKFSEALINLGNLYLKQKDYASAIQILQKAIEADPNNSKIHFLLATVYREAKQYPQALLHYQKVLEIDSQNTQAQNFVGVINYELKNYQKSEEAFLKVIAIDPDFADAYGNLGILYNFNLNDKNKAIYHFEKFLSIKSDGENVALIKELLSKAKSSVQKNQKKTDTETSVNMLSVDNKNPNDLEEIRVLISQGQYEKAKAELESIGASYSNREDAKILWSIINSKALPPNEAERVLKEAILINKNSSDLWYELGDLYKKNGSQEAVYAYEEALRLSPNDPRALLAKDTVASLKQQNQTRSLAPKTNPPAIVIVKDALETKDNTAVDKSLKDKVSSLDIKVSVESKNKASSYFNSGVSFQSKGQNALAINEYQKAVSLNPNHLKAHYNLGILYKWKGEYDKALEEYKETIRIDPNFSKAYYNSGIILKEKGLYNDAISKFKKAMQIDPRYSDAYLGLGVIYSQVKKDQKQAVLYYKKYLQLSPSGPTSIKIRSWLKSVGEDG